MASERLVEIVKGVIPWLTREKLKDSWRECWRRAILHILAVGAGILTAYLSSDVIRQTIDGAEKLTWGPGCYVVVGFLISGGSGLWNSILTYLLKVKDLKSAEVEKAKQ